MSTYKQILRDAQKRMVEADLGDQAAQLYLLELANMQSHDLYMEFENDMPSALIEQYVEGIERMLKGEPLGHVLGFEWFYGYKFTVNEDVLIPRPETEELVANILAAYDEYFADSENVTAVDVGTGSGAIAISLKKEEPSMQIMGTDISLAAVKVANQNAKDNQAMVPFIAGDMLQPLIDRNLKVDILISNPPYIPQDEEMEATVVEHEPHVALFGGEDGLKFYRIIFENCKKVLKDRAMMAFEMGWNQREAMSALVEAYLPDATYEIMKDMSGKDRMLFVYFNL